MTPEIRETIINSFLEVSSEFAFLMLEVMDDLPEESKTSPCLESTLVISGDKTGKFRILIHPGVAAEIAANMMAIDEDSDEAKAHAPESVKEYLNVIAGHLTVILYGDGADITLEPPSCKELDGITLTEGDEIILFGDSDRPIVLSMTLPG